jgi:MFS family permease
VSPALVNGLAPEHLRGRYNALASMTWTISMVVGPATAGLLLGNGLPGVWVALTVGGTAVAAVGFVLLGRSLSRRQEGLTDEAEASPVEPSLQLTAL